jgi:hypothetical protein
MLPVDKLCATLKPFIPDNARLPARRGFSSTHPAVTYASIKASIITQAQKDWASIPLTSESYPYKNHSSLPLTLHLPKFLAGRILQMRAGRSYLAGQTSWYNHDSPRTCPRCDNNEEETFTHAILTCPAKSSERDALIPDILTVDEMAPLWKSSELLYKLASFIRATRTNFPLKTPTPGPTITPIETSGVTSDAGDEQEMVFNTTQ